MMEIRKLLSNLKWNLKFYLNYLSNSSFRAAMKNNKNLENIHMGETCFIVGNGPSIKEENLNKLTNQFVFSVNDIYKNNKIYDLLNSDVHVFIDPDYAAFSNEQFNNLLRDIENKKMRKYCLCSTDCIKYNSLFSNYNLIPIYIYMHKNWIGNSCKINLNKNVYTVQNVVQAAILLAFAMGFKKIYIMGCEMTSFYENLEYNANGILLQNHAHDVEESAYKHAKKLRDNTYMLKDYYTTFSIFKKIKDMSTTYNTNIINLTRGGILDMFERDDYNNVLC